MRLLLSACASLYCFHAKQIKEFLMILNSKQKRLYQLATTELFPNETRKQQKMTKARLGLMPYISVF